MSPAGFAEHNKGVETVKSVAEVLPTTQKLQQDCAVLVCTVVLWQSS